MKILLLSAITVMLSVAHTMAEDQCEGAVSEFTKSIEKAPESLLATLSDAITSHPGCECQLVKVAIANADENKGLIREIVITAVSASPEESATIAECALASAPEAAKEISKALSETFEGAKAPIASSKQAYRGKEPVYPAAKDIVIDEQDDFAPMPKTVSGVYLIAPIAPASGASDRERLARELGISTKELDRILKHGGKTLVDVLRRRPHRERDPGDDSTPSQQTP